MPRKYSAFQYGFGFLLWVLLFVSLPLSPLHLVFTLVYQVGCVVGKLTPTARVATFVLCVFFAIAWIPFACLLLYYFHATDLQRGDIGVQINGLVPICTLAIFYVWGSGVAFRVYSIDASYEEEQDRQAVIRLKQFSIVPAVRIRSKQHRDMADVTDAYELYTALKRENPANATTVALVVGCALSAVATTAARVTQYVTAKGHDYDWNDEPAFTLTTIYFAGMFLVFFSTFAFVATLYVNHNRIVWLLTFLFSGAGHVETSGETAARLMLLEGSRSPTDTTGAASPASRVQQRGINEADSEDEENVPTVNASPTRRAFPAIGSSSGADSVFATSSEYSFLGGNSAPTMQRDEAFYRDQIATGGSVMFRHVQRSKTVMEAQPDGPGGFLPGADIAAGPTAVTSMLPYNLAHIRAWDEVRRVAAAYIASPDSTLNAFLTPTMWFAALGTAAGYLYLVITFAVSFHSIGPFNVSVAVQIVCFAVFIFAMVFIAKKARRHFKLHNVIIARITFDVACELEARVPLVQQGIENVRDRRPGMEKLELSDLTRLYDSLLALLSFMDSTSPRPLILGIEQRHLRHAVAYALLFSGAVLGVALLRVMRHDDSPCNDAVSPNATGLHH
jgi:hypothetical protein